MAKDDDGLPDLLDALTDIFQPQANLCSFGGDKRINATEYLRQRYPNG